MATGTLVVVIGVGHDVVVQLLAELATDAAHEATGTFVVLLVVQTVAV